MVRPSTLPPWAGADSHALVTVLSVVYVHRRTTDGGDIYLTRHALPYVDHLELENWYEPTWFRQHRVRLEGTSAVYRVPTREVSGSVLDLVVKNCRVGEDVPVDTRTVRELLGAEFNSPWEEFALVEEVRAGRFGAPELTIRTQEPLAIYVPPEPMQLWQSGRSRSRINAIRAKHPGIDLDILKEYKLVYRWIHGQDVVEVLNGLALPEARAWATAAAITERATADLAAKGYVVADMKPVHVIIAEAELPEVTQDPEGTRDPEVLADQLEALVERGSYSVIDYELLKRTAEHEEQTRSERRHHYLDAMRDRMEPTELPEHLDQVELLGVPYVHGVTESTGGQLWVVGRNARLFDYFLPERWRTSVAWELSARSPVHYTITKDRIHLVWKEARVGELPPPELGSERCGRLHERGFNCPFEAFAYALDLAAKGVPTVNVRAIYMTGATELDEPADRRRYERYRELRGRDGLPVLRERHDYLTLRGFYNGPDEWVAATRGELHTPLGLPQAVARGVLASDQPARLLEAMRERLAEVGYDGCCLEPNDLIVAVDASGRVVADAVGAPIVRLTNFEVVYPLSEVGWPRCPTSGGRTQS